MRKFLLSLLVTTFLSSQIFPAYAQETSTQIDYSKAIEQLAEQSRDEANRLDEQIKEQANLKRDQFREEYAKDCYQKGLVLTEQGRFAEARIYFNKAIQVTQRTEMAQNIKEGEKRLQIQEEALKKAQQEMDAARLLRLKVQEEQRLKIAQEKQQKEEQARLDKERLQRAEDIKIQKQIREDELKSRRQQEAARIKEQEAAELKAKQDEEQRRKELTAQTEARRTQLERAEHDYQAALDLFRDKMYEEAKERFESLTKEFPDYKASNVYLKKIDLQIKAKELKEQKEQERKAKEEEIRALKLKKEEERQARQQEAEALKRQQEETRSLKEKEALELKEKREAQLKEEAERQRALLEEEKAKAAESKPNEAKMLEKNKQEQALLEDLYQKALISYRQNKLAEAKQLFLDLEQRAPDYKATANYLKNIDLQIAKDDSSKERFAQEEKANKEKEEAELKAKKELEDRLAVLRKEKDAKELRDRQTEELYTAAVDLYRDRLYKESQERFETLVKDFGHYKSSASYLEKITRHLALKEKNALLERQREEADKRRQAAFEKKELQERLKAQEADAKRNEPPKKDIQEEENLDKVRRQELEKENIKNERAALKQEELRRKREALLEAKEKNNASKKSADADYEAAIEFFKEGKYTEAKYKFQSVLAKNPEHRSAQAFLERVEHKLQKTATLTQREQQKIIQQKKKETEEARRLQDKRRKWLERHRKNDLVNLKKKEKPSAQTQKVLPIPAVSTAAVAVVPVPVVPSSPASVEKVSVKAKEVAKESVDPVKEKTDEDELLAKLAEKSSRLYQEISQISDDRPTATAKSKLAKLDSVLANIKEEKEKTQRQLREEEERKRQQLLKDKESLRSKEVAPIYEEGVMLVSSREFNKAKRKFLEVESILPDYKATRRYLKHIDEDQRRMQEEALAEKSKDDERRLKEEQARKRQEEERARKLRISQLQDRSNELAREAASVNDDILKLTVAKNYLQAKEKFDKLEEIMAELKRTKELIANERDSAELIKEQAKELEASRKQSEAVMREKRLENRQLEEDARYKKQQEQDERAAQAFKLKENKQQRDVMFRQGLELFKRKKYNEAKIIFTELEAKSDPRAASYLKKIEQYVKAEPSAEEDQKNTRSEYLAERLNQQRVKRILEEKDEERQRKLARDLQKQKEALEDKKKEEARRLESIRIQQKERERLEQERAALEAKRKAQEEQLSFRKVTSSPQASSSTTPTAQTNDDVKFLSRELPAAKELTVTADDPSENRVRKISTRSKSSSSEIERSVKERQQALDKERLAIRRQLESGVESMYAEAVKLYKSGNYQAAASRFSDVQDLIPDYKSSGDYLKKAESRLQQAPVPIPKTQQMSTSVQSPSKQDQVTRALDLLDGNLN